MYSYDQAVRPDGDGAPRQFAGEDVAPTERLIEGEEREGVERIDSRTIRVSLDACGLPPSPRAVALTTRIRELQTARSRADTVRRRAEADRPRTEATNAALREAISEWR